MEGVGLPLALDHVHLHVPGPPQRVVLHGRVGRVEPLQELLVPEHDVRLEEVFVEGVDARADARVPLQPLARARVDRRAHQVDGGAPVPNGPQRSPRRPLVPGVPRQPREEPQLQDQGAGRRRARLARLARGHALEEVHAVDGEARLGLEGGEEAGPQVLRQLQQLVLVQGPAVREHGRQLLGLEQRVRREEAAWLGCWEGQTCMPNNY